MKLNKIITEVLVNEDKSQYICLQRQKNVSDNIYTAFNVHNGIIQPSLTLNINRIIRVQKILKLFPEIILMNADGNRIIIDCLSKVISFNPDEISQGVIQYSYDAELNYNILSIFYNCITFNVPISPNVVQCSIDSEYEFKSLKIFSIILNRGGIISINDGIEKILHLPILDPQFGFIGETPDDVLYFSRLNLIRKIWPELGLTLIVKNTTIKVYSDILKYEYNNENPGIIKCHRNHGSNDLLLSMTHICQKF